MHVLSLVETWSDSGKPENSIAGFTLLCNNTRTKHKKARRCSGRIACSIQKNDLCKGVSMLSYSHSNIVMIKIDKTFFHLKVVMVFCFVHNFFFPTTRELEYLFFLSPKA